MLTLIDAVLEDVQEIAFGFCALTIVQRRNHFEKLGRNCLLIP